MIGALITKSKIRSAFSYLNQHNADAFLANWAEDAAFSYPSYLSAGGEIRGKKAIEEWLRRWLEQFPQVSFILKHVCLENALDMVGTNRVVVEYEVNLTNRDGKEFEISGVMAISLKKGKAVLGCDYHFDPEAAKKAWGEE